MADATAELQLADFFAVGMQHVAVAMHGCLLQIMVAALVCVGVCKYISCCRCGTRMTA